MILFYITKRGGGFTVIAPEQREYFRWTRGAPCDASGLREMSPEERRDVYLRHLVAIAEWRSSGELAAEWDEPGEASLEAFLDDTCVIEAEYDDSEPETDEVAALKAEIAAQLRRNLGDETFCAVMAALEEDRLPDHFRELLPTLAVDLNTASGVDWYAEQILDMMSWADAEPELCRLWYWEDDQEPVIDRLLEMSRGQS